MGKLPAGVPSDVTAVVLTLGEAATRRAIASVRRQTLAPAEVLVVDEVRPFFRALNSAASRARTPFFVQVDADMVLDVDCLANLRAHMGPGVGAVVGPLHDPLIGRVQGVKLFRRACFDGEEVPNSISPDTDFLARLERQGWQVVHLTGVRDEGRHSADFGQHRPDFTPGYTYATYYLLGGRYRYRRDVRGLTWRLESLRSSRHAMALTARVAIGHGLFMLREDDVPKSFPPRAEAQFLDRFLRTSGDFAAERELRAALALPAHRAVERAYALGVALRCASAGVALRRCVRAFDRTSSPVAWVPEVGLYHGLLSLSGPRRLAPGDRETIAALIEQPPPVCAPRSAVAAIS
jgi:hypothetical protein